MRVAEIKNNLVKIAYDTEDNLTLSGFVIIQDTNTPYVGQIMNIKADSNSNYAIVKLLFTFNEEGILKNYNGTIPSLKATVSALPAKELLDIIPAEEPLILGQLAQQNTLLKIDKSILENNLLICSNNFANTLKLIENITSQLNEKVVIIDTEGNFETGTKIVFGKDFQLPLNYDTINFIYENDLDDVDAINKAVIQDIFIEVQEYTKTLPEKFLPFESFLNVVDAQYKETKIPQLVLLKNKLLKYKDLNIFEQNLKNILDLSITIENSNITTIDVSAVPENIQKEAIMHIYSVMNTINNKILAFIKIDDENSNKKLIKQLIARTNVFTSIICSHSYKYLAQLKELAQNLILFAPLTLQHDFASYNTFLNKLNNDEFIVYGAHTQNIPLITELANLNSLEVQEEEHNDVVEEEPETNEIIEEDNENITPDKEIVEEAFENNIEEIQDFPQIEYPELDEIKPEPVEVQPVEIIENILEDNEEMSAEDNSAEFPEIIEEIPQEINNNEDITLEDESFEPILNDSDENKEELIEQVAQDVDKVFYEKLSSDDELPPQEESDEPFELTEDDLNLIDDLASDELSEEVFETEETPIVPIYPAEELEESEVQTFEPGDRVSTPKYGEGVVEKMIKYGNKMLCSIDFPNIGRRLLDPAMTEITKL